MRKFFAATAFSLGCVAFSPAFADEHGGKMKEKSFEETFNMVDANGDGFVTSEEFMDYKMKDAEKEWAKWASGAGDDGRLSMDEAQAVYEEMKMKKKEKMKDKN